MSYPYMPSNGTEGMDFEGRFCQRCAAQNICKINLNAMLGKQPVQWIADDGIGKNARCTSFRVRGGKRIHSVRVESLPLFGEGYK